MEFSLRRISERNMHYWDSETDSRIQLVFTPGAFTPELWKHQLRYFSRSYRTISFRPTRSYRGFEGERNCLENVLEQDSIDSAVVVSNIVGNPVLESVQDRNDVIGMVRTGTPESLRLPSKSLYRLFWAVSTRKPKLMKKFLFSDQTDYRTVKEFVGDLEVPGWENYGSFVRKKDGVVSPETCMSIFPEDDRFSSLEAANRMRKICSVSSIQRAGTFPFYERPQDYNKVLNDYLEQRKHELEEEQILKAKSNNRSLFEFENQREEKRVRKVKR